MADGEQDQEQKTEQPTQKRLDEALKKGNVPVSKEVANFFVLSALAAIVAWCTPNMLRQTGRLLTPLLADADSLPVDANGIGKLLLHIVLGGMGIVAVPMLMGIVAVLAASFLQNGFVVSSEPVMPKFSRLSPLEGIKRMFSMRSVIELVKSLAKLGIVGYVAFLAVYPELTNIKRLPNSNTEAMLMFLLMLASRMTLGVAIAMFIIAILDTLYQRFQYFKSLRMTRQEIKDEYKQAEGDPMVKQRLRRLRMERAKNRMMSNVPKSDVVITNPTHFAVALQYDSASMKAPKVVAKGQDLIALKIRELAKANDVPIVENPPLARALFDAADIDEEIPTAQYEAVAKVISYVYQLKGRRR